MCPFLNNLKIIRTKTKRLLALQIIFLTEIDEIPVYISIKLYHHKVRHSSQENRNTMLTRLKPILEDRDQIGVQHTKYVPHTISGISQMLMCVKLS